MNSFLDFLWVIIVTFAFVAYLIILFQIVTDLFRDKEQKGWHKAVWIIFLIVFPLLTAVIYLITFLLAWVAPGDPFQNERGMDPIVKRTLERQYHAESGWQFLRYHSWNVIRHGDFGP